MKKQSMSQYWAAGIILLLGLVVSGAILIRTGILGWQHAPAQSSAPAEDLITHSVRFLSPGGTVLREARVPHGQSVLPPELHPVGAVHTGWSSELFHVTEELEVTPLLRSTEGVKNAVYANCVYAPADGEIAVTIELGGEVACCGFVIEAAYDRELLSLEQVEPLLEGVKTEEKNGILILSFSNGEPLTGEQELARLRFTSDSRDMYSTTIPLTTREIYAQDGSLVRNTDSTAYDGRLFLMGTERKERK